MGQDQALERLYFMKHYKQWNFSQYSTIYYEFYFFFFYHLHHKQWTLLIVSQSFHEWKQQKLKMFFLFCFVFIVKWRAII